MNQLSLGCSWPGGDVLMRTYHDTEWGVPVYDDAKLFEYMVLDAFQAGLSWKTVLYKREGFRTAFAGFDVQRVAQLGPEESAVILQNPAIIRNRQKVAATIQNARKFLEIQKEYGTFAEYIWQFVGGTPLVSARKGEGDIPATSAESDAMSAALRARGFKFVGSTICYAFMQAAGMVNDHVVSCPRYAECLAMKRTETGQ